MKITIIRNGIVMDMYDEPVAIIAAPATEMNKSKLVSLCYGYQELQELTRNSDQDTDCQLAFNQGHVLSKSIQNRTAIGF